MLATKQLLIFKTIVEVESFPVAGERVRRIEVEDMTAEPLQFQALFSAAGAERAAGSAILGPAGVR